MRNHFAAIAIRVRAEAHERSVTVLQELHDCLTARYPCMCAVPEDQIDDTVWSDGPLNQ